MRKFMIGGLVAALLSSSALATTVPLVASSPTFNEPSQIVSTLNSYTQTLNGVLAGQFAGLPAPLTTSGTSANTVMAYSVTPGMLGSGQVIRIKGWGVNSADANAKTITVNFGTSAPTVVVTASAATWQFECDIQNVGTVASPSQNIGCFGQQGTTAIAVANTNSTQALTAALTLNVQMTAATSGTMTMNGLSFEIVR